MVKKRAENSVVWEKDRDQKVGRFMNRSDRPWKQPGRQWLAAHFGGHYPRRSPSVRWTRKGTSLPTGHCRWSTGVVKARPQVMKGATLLWTTGAKNVLCFQRLTILAPTLSKKPSTRAQTDLQHNAAVPPPPSVCTDTAPSQTSDDNMKPSRAVPPPNPQDGII